jgi:hypothetical protein
LAIVPPLWDELLGVIAPGSLGAPGEMDAKVKERAFWDEIVADGSGPS